MQHNEGAKPSAVPQRIYDWYNAHYSNASYRAFRDALTESAQYGMLSESQTNEEFINIVMNLLIDASFERSGAERYHGAEAQLLTQIAPLDSRLTTLAHVHLLNFDGSPDQEVGQAFKEARLLTETAAQRSSDLHSWRGRAAFAWASAAVFLLHAAVAVLDETDSHRYKLEKLDRALLHLQNGVTEAERNGVLFNEGFTAWIRRLVNARR